MKVDLLRYSLNGNELTSKGVSVLLETLQGCDSILLKLNLSRNQIDDECMKKMGEFVNDNEYLEGLFLSNNKISNKGVEILSNHLIGNVVLKSLYLGSNNDITDTSVPYLLETVKLSNITSIYLADTSITRVKNLEIQNALQVPIEEREIPLRSNTKSAAKLSASITAKDEGE